MSGDESPPRKVSVEQLAAEDERKLFVGGGSRNTTENTMFVGGLPNETKHEDLKTHFARYGAVEKVKLMSDQVRNLLLMSVTNHCFRPPVASKGLAL